MTPEEKKLKQYMNAIERKLKVSLEMKARINGDLGTEIHLKMEQGKTLDEIMQEMGTPEEVAARFNARMGGSTEKKTSPFIWILLIFTVFFLMRMTVSLMSFIMMQSEGISIIGGADGPTSVFIAGKIASPAVDILTYLSLGVGCLGGYLLLKYHGKKSQWKAGAVCGGIGVVTGVAACILGAEFLPWAAAGAAVSAAVLAYGIYQGKKKK